MELSFYERVLYCAHQNVQIHIEIDVSHHLFAKGIKCQILF